MKESRLPDKISSEQVIDLGMRLKKTESLTAQCRIITNMVKKLTGGQVDTWLSDGQLRLPGKTRKALISAGPPSDQMKNAIALGKTIQEQSPDQLLVIPIMESETILGAIQIIRTEEQPFVAGEISDLESLAAYIGLAITNAHHKAIQQWRLEQLNLVQKVSSQIVDILDLDELVKRLTQLIQKTFNYYYVSIFTSTPSKDKLVFRSSAGPAGKKRKKKSSLEITVEVGQGLIGTVAQEGQEIVCNDIHNEPLYKFHANLPETQSEVVLPLKIEDKLLGVLDVQSNELNAFHRNDLIVLKALAANISIAIEGAYLYGDLEQRTRQLSLVTEVSRDITSILDVEELLDKVACSIHERLGYPHVHLFSVHPNRRRIYHEAGSGSIDISMEGHSIDLDSTEGLIPWAAQNGKTIVANDISKDPRYIQFPVAPENTLSEMVVPLLFDNQVLGILDIQADVINAFSDEDRQICEALADNIAIAMHNADLYKSEKWRRQIADSMREVTGLLSANASVDDVLDSILIELEKDLPCDLSAIWLLDGKDIFLAHVRGADPIDVEIARDNWPESVNFLEDAINSETPIIRKPFDPIGPSGAAKGYSADYSSIAARLQIGDQPLGVLTLANPIAGSYGHEAQSITSTFAGYAAVAIENARLYDAAQEQAYASAALLQVAQSVANAENLDELLVSISRITPILVGVESCAIFLYHSGSFITSQAYGLSDEIEERVIGKVFMQGEFPLLEKVEELNQMVVGSLSASDPESWINPKLALTKEDHFYAMEMGERLLIGYPLSIKNDFFGVILIEETSDDRRFRQKRVDIVKGIAQQLAMSIQNEQFQLETAARERLEYEFTLARQIQQTFLPEKMPEINNWELAAYWKPARQVGGDFYDVCQLPNGELGLIIADVSDKGIPAAIFMAVTRTLMRAVILDGLSPAEVLRRLNDLLIPENKQGMFVTMVYAVLSLEKNTLTYANAGHNPPFLVNVENESITKLTMTGMAVGIEEKSDMGEREVHFDKNDCILLYTDGVTESTSPEGDFFGDDRLEKLLGEKRSDSPEEIVRSIKESVFDFMESDILSDDLTMMVIKRLK